MAETRTYQEAHPWLRFQLDLHRLDYTLWFQLGEVQAKCEQVAGVPHEDCEYLLTKLCTWLNVGN